VERLVQLALRGGGPDNITVVIADAIDTDIVEQAPIVGGAAAIDRGNTTVADSSTPAARASALQAPRPPQPEPATNGYDNDPEPKGHPIRTSLLLLALLAVLGGGLWLGYRYTQHQYYVGATEAGQLAIFRGVPGQIAGLDLSSVSSTSGAKLEDLTAVAQERVKQGIHAENQLDAEHRLAELTDDTPTNPNLKPLCTTTSTAPITSTSGAPSTLPSTGKAPVAGTSPAPIIAASIPAAPAADSASPVNDPVGCRSAN
jgi:protein phosphatase